MLKQYTYFWFFNCMYHTSGSLVTALVHPNSYMRSWNIWNYEFRYEKIIWIHSLHEFMCEFIHIHMNSYNHFTKTYMKWLHEIISYHIWNDYMKSYHIIYIWFHKYDMIWFHIWNEYMNSCIWIQMCRFWIHIWIHMYKNSDILIHSIQSEFMNLISCMWIHDMNS